MGRRILRAGCTSGRVAGPIFALMSIGGCSCAVQGPTQIIVGIATNMAVPAEVDTLHFQAEHLGSLRFENTYDLVASDNGGLVLPATIALNGGPNADQPVTVTATAKKGTVLLVRRQARLPWSKGRKLFLRLDIVRKCAHLVCEPGMTTCIDGTCLPIDVDPALLPSYSDDAAFGGFDGGMDGWHPCVADPSLCDDDQLCTVDECHPVTGCSSKAGAELLVQYSGLATGSTALACGGSEEVGSVTVGECSLVGSCELDAAGQLRARLAAGTCGIKTSSWITTGCSGDCLMGYCLSCCFAT